MTRRLRTDESGFTLIELLMALAIGSLILTAVMMVFINGLQAAGRVTDRVEASQRARLSMDRITTLLNSQTCTYANDGSTSVPIVDGQAQQVTFYANLGLVNADPIKYRLRYDAPTLALYEDRWVPTRDSKGNAVYPATITKSVQLATNLVPTLPGGTIFRYYQFNTVDGTIDPTPMSTAAGLAVGDRLKTVRVAATIAAQPERTKKLDLRSTTVDGAATVGSADGSDPSKGVNC
jgi:prepilin-type N-terminal cleavage/methylation domain-containing protein